MAANAIITEHQLDFESAPWVHRLNLYGWKLYRVGTCNGQWRYTIYGFEILSFFNASPGNGHLNDVFQWFEFSCTQNKVPLLIRAMLNKRFKKHLIKKRGFMELGKNDLIKYFGKGDSL